MSLWNRHPHAASLHRGGLLKVVKSADNADARVLLLEKLNRRCRRVFARGRFIGNQNEVELRVRAAFHSPQAFRHSIQ